MGKAQGKGKHSCGSLLESPNQDEEADENFLSVPFHNC